MLTDVPGVYANWPDTTEIISQISAQQLRAMVPDLSEGMIPKLTACLAAVDGGVGQAHVLDGRVPHALLLEVFTDAGVGTLVVGDDGVGAVADDSVGVVADDTVAAPVTAEGVDR
jgi:acetylglutamate kinase